MNKSFFKKLGIAIIGTAITSLMFSAAVYVPEMIIKYVDKSGDESVSEMNVNTLVYDNKISSFSDKMQAIYDEGENDQLSFVYINEDNTKISDEELTKAVNNELEALVSSKFLSNVLTVNKNEIVSRELYSIYSKDTKCKLTGVKLWRVKYESKTNKVYLYIDVDSLKIYRFRIESEKERENCKNMWDFVVSDEKIHPISEFISDYYGETVPDNLSICCFCEPALMQKMGIYDGYDEFYDKKYYGIDSNEQYDTTQVYKDDDNELSDDKIKDIALISMALNEMGDLLYDVEYEDGVILGGFYNLRNLLQL